VSVSLDFRAPLAVLACAAVLLAPALAQAHGTMTTPPSRIYTCYQSGPETTTDPACVAFKNINGAAPFYNWMSINQAAANSNHPAVVPDGKLCSGNNPTFSGLDLARSDWQASTITPDANGNFQFVFRGTAPHATKDWIFYITREGYTPTQPLKWSDLFEFCRLGNVPVNNGNYNLTCPLPQGGGKRVIYSVWQRSDSQEAFYTCIDVNMGGTPNPTWTDEGALVAQGALATGTVVRLRLFNAQGNDVETIAHTVAAGQGGASQWPYRFALAVNAQSARARIGVLGSGGTVTPQQSASANRVYTLTAQNLSHQVDIQLPGGNQPPVAVATASSGTVSGAGSVTLSGAGSSDPDGNALSYQWSLVSGSGASLGSTSGVQTTLNLAAPAQGQTVVVRLSVSDGIATATADVSIAHQPASSGSYDYVYPAGLGSYVAGQTVVLGSDGNRYRCRPAPEGGWCNINSAYHYAPGSGVAWTDAWTRL
jgi:predicted carbohydrate-binding protein with CBM5 and CBM33 domain